MKVAPALLSAVVVLSAVPVPAQAPPADQKPSATFKSAIDLVPVDVSVIDKDGRPIPDLAAGDFVLTVDGRSRTIASAQFIATSRQSILPDPPPSHYSSNAAATGGRLIMLVIDQGSIGTARGKYAADAAARFIGRLNPADRVGLQTLPGAGPQIDFTANHALVKTMLQNIVGQSPSGHGSSRVGLSEALALERGNEQLVAEVLDRECPGVRTPEEIAVCRSQVANEARSMFAETKSRTRDSLLSLRHLMERLAENSSPKTVVLLSEGILLDRDIADVSWLGPLSAKGQMSLYVFQLEPPLYEAAAARVSPSRSADIDLAQEGLGMIAGMARGTVLRVVNNTDGAFNRLALELSGYYLLSFAPDTGDRDGKVHKIRIDLRDRKGLELRFRREFAINAARERTNDELLAETLRSALLASEVGVKVSTYTLGDKEKGKLRIVIASEIDRSQSPGGPLALAYALVDARGGLVSSQVESEVMTPIAPNRTQSYFGAISAVPGVYTLKLAVVDAAGKRGSVEHLFRAQMTASGQIHMTDLLIADSAPGTRMTPAVSADFSGDSLQGYLELYSEAPELLKNATAVIEVAANEQARALDSANARLQPADAQGARVLEASVPIALLPPGNYVARAIVSSGGRKVGQVSRPFRIVRAAPRMTAPGAGAPPAPASTSGATAPIPFASKIEAFDRASVLTPPVVGFFVDRMNVGNRIGNAPPAVIDAIRGGRFDAALEAMKGATPVATAFVGGLALYAKNDLAGAAVKFREALKLDSEFFPAAFYLGAVHAAAGRDRDAAGAWQTSLITQSDAPFIYTLLADAFTRLKSYDSAVDILVEASQLWPGVDEVQMRLGLAQALAGKGADAIATLDRHLGRHPDDQASLLAAMRVIYETRSAGKGIGTAVEDRERFKRYAAAYTAAGGPANPEIERWRKFIDR